MQALFIGQTYIDVTFLTDRMPTGDEKHVASAYAVSFGGNAVTAAFCCAKLGIVPDVLTTVADDWLGRMFSGHGGQVWNLDPRRKVRTSSLSFIMPNDGKRAIVRCRDDDYLHPFPDPEPLRLPCASPRRTPAGCRDSLRQAVPGNRDSHLARRRRAAVEYARTPRLHRRGDRGRAPVPADGA